MLVALLKGPPGFWRAEYAHEACIGSPRSGYQRTIDAQDLRVVSPLSAAVLALDRVMRGFVSVIIAMIIYAFFVVEAV